MARKASEDRKTNEFDPAVVKDLVKRWDACNESLASEKGSYMRACREIREDMQGLLEEAKARGVPKKELRLFLKARGRLADARRILDDIEDDAVKLTVEQLAVAFGDAKDLPLFESAMKAAATEAEPVAA